MVFAVCIFLLKENELLGFTCTHVMSPVKWTSLCNIPGGFKLSASYGSVSYRFIFPVSVQSVYALVRHVWSQLVREIKIGKGDGRGRQGNRWSLPLSIYSFLADDCHFSPLSLTLSHQLSSCGRGNVFYRCSWNLFLSLLNWTDGDMKPKCW